MTPPGARLGLYSLSSVYKWEHLFYEKCNAILLLAWIKLMNVSGRLLCVVHMTDTDLGPLPSASQGQSTEQGGGLRHVLCCRAGEQQAGFREEAGRNETTQRPQLQPEVRPEASSLWESTHSGPEYVPKKRGKMKPSLPCVPSPLLRPPTEGTDGDPALTFSPVGPQILCPLPWEHHAETSLRF